MQLAIEMGDGSSESLRVEADGGPIVIGRDESCHVVLPSPDVSRRHVTLELEGDHLKITDTSANGTYYGEQPERCITSTSAVISRDDSFRVGPYRLRVLTVGEEDTAVDPERTSPGDATEKAAQRILASLREVPDHRAITVTDMPAIVIPDEPRRGSQETSGLEPLGGDIRRRIRAMLHDHLGPEGIRGEDAESRARVRAALSGICRELERDLPAGTRIPRLVEELTEEALGLGPLRTLLADPQVREVVVVEPGTIVVEKGGRVVAVAQSFSDDEACRAVIDRVLAATGHRIDEDHPIVDAMLPDGSTVHAIIPPVAARGPSITIRKAMKSTFALLDLVKLGTLSMPMAELLRRAVLLGKDILVSGAEGSGRTTMLGALATAVPAHERIVTIQDDPEIHLDQPQWIALCPRRKEGGPSADVLLGRAMSMRADRIVIGELGRDSAAGVARLRGTGPAVITALQAHGAAEAIARARELGGGDGPTFDLVVHLHRYRDGIRRITVVAEIDAGAPAPVYQFEQTGIDADGKVEGEHRATGRLPEWLLPKEE